MKNRILTMDDLVKFCSENQMLKFNSDNTGYKICVQIPSTYEYDENKSDDSLLYGTVKVFHTNTNRNRSSVTKEAAEKCLSSIKYKPLLANFCEVDGVKDFTSHDMLWDEDGNCTYLEHQIGCFTSDEPYMEYEEETDRYYVYATVAIPRGYTDAAEIIERKGGTKVSAELAINSMSYDADSKVLVLEDIEVMGVTCLGLNPNTGDEVQEGMQGARLDIADFSINNNSLNFENDEKLVKIIQEAITSALDNYKEAEASQNLRKEDETMHDVEIEQIENEKIESEIEETVIENEEVEVEETEVEPETDVEEVPVEENEFSVDYSVKLGENEKNFSISLSDKLYAMTELVNETYGEMDNDYYTVNVYEEEGFVEMYGCWYSKAYRQNFKCKKEKYSLVGDRCEIFARWLTNDEITQLDHMRENYSLISDKLAKYEAEPEKMEILNSSDYGYVSETEEFIALKEVDAHFNLSIDEVKDKANEILLKYAKAHAFSLEKNDDESKKISVKQLNAAPRKQGRYGNLFSK